MPATYEPIVSTVLTSAASPITFNSLPSGYTDLVLQIVGLVSVDLDPGSSNVQFNGDTGTNYSYTTLIGGPSGTSKSSSRAANMTVAQGSAAGMGFGQATLHLMSYSNTSVFKTSLLSFGAFDSAGTLRRVGAIAGLWRSTSAITSISFLSLSGFDYAAGSRFSVYGIKAA